MTKRVGSDFKLDSLLGLGMPFGAVNGSHKRCFKLSFRSAAKGREVVFT